MPEEIVEEPEYTKNTITIIRKNNIMTNALSFAGGALIGVSGLVIAAVLSRDKDEISIKTKEVEKSENDKK